MIAYIDCRMGVSGDMLVAAMIDAGADVDAIGRYLKKLRIGIDTQTVSRAGLTATSVSFETADVSARTMSEVVALLDRAALGADVGGLARAICKRLAVAEAKIHGVSVDAVHFHELSAGDTVADAVAFAAAIKTLGLGRVLTSEVGVGSGIVETQHGLLPVPAPATLALLSEASIPISPGPADEELATPTGAACLAAVATYSAMPSMRVTSHGYGAGARDFSTHPNAVRILLGDVMAGDSLDSETLVQIEATIDDMNPEFYEYVIDQLRDAGVADAWVVPAIGKRGRPAAILTALCAEELEQSVVRIFVTETSTLGVRVSPARRWHLDREIYSVDVRGVPVRIKVGMHEGEIVNASPEYADCVEAARKLEVPLKQIYVEAMNAWSSKAGE